MCGLDDYDEVFKQLKSRLATKLDLAVPNISCRVIIYNKASGRELGYVLMQLVV